MAFEVNNDYKASIVDPPGSNLASPGSYRSQIAAVLPNYPGLGHKQKLWADDSWLDKSSRAALCNLTTLDNGKTVVQSDIFYDATSLSKALAVKETANGSQPIRNLLILEGLQPEFVAAIGEAWQVDPLAFQRHEFTGLWTSENSSPNYIVVPSDMDPKKTFTFNYWEMVYFLSELPSDVLRSAENHRMILTTSIGKQRDRTGIVGRKASFWSDCTPGGGWQALIIVDCALQHVITGKGDEARTLLLPHRPFQGGYHDPVHYKNLKDIVETPGPPRKSALDDLLHYLAHHSHDMDILRPSATTKFLKLIAYSHMNQVYHYTRSLYDLLEYQLDRRQNFAVQNPEATLQPFWADLHHFRRRTEFFSRNIANTVLQLGVDEFQMSPLEVKDPADKNFVFLQRQLRDLENRSSRILAGYGVLSQIAGSQQGLLEAKAAQYLQYLAIVFLPLSFAASLFSMDQKYNLGQERFWAYVVTAIVLLYLALLGAWLVRPASRAWLRTMVSSSKSVKVIPLAPLTPYNTQTRFKSQKAGEP